eukprot:7306941-Alexandrium_andersonii.AAC.1
MAPTAHAWARERLCCACYLVPGARLTGLFVCTSDHAGAHALQNSITHDGKRDPLPWAAEGE